MKESQSIYLAITIGPVFRTITRARKTRELWASSFIFSLLMRKILDGLKGYKKLMPYDPPAGAPVFDAQGAGLWPDRCVVELSGGEMPDVKQLLDGVFDALAADLAVKDADSLKSLFSVHVLRANWKEISMKEGMLPGEENDLLPLHRLQRLLDNLELGAHYQPKEEPSLNVLLEDWIHKLYTVAAHKQSKVFIALPDGSVRLPSLPEIALTEIKESPDLKDSFAVHIEVPINEKIMVLRKEKKRAKDYDFDGQKANEQIYEKLREVLPKDSVDFRHKYIAVVAADGDSVGKLIAEKSRKGGLEVFSESLMEFAKDAVGQVVAYGGLPVYAGGDDLLFIAPVTNEQAEKSKNVIQLCQQLNTCFKEKISENVSLSFGLSITYYKFPLGEAVREAYALQEKAKDFKIWRKSEGIGEKFELLYAKQALSFQLRKHSGQALGATIGLDLRSTEQFMHAILKADEEVENSFLSSVMHSLRKLPVLVASAARDSSLEHFRTHHFNEGGKHDKQFLKEAMKVLELIFEDYGDFAGSAEGKEKEASFSEQEIADFDLYRVNIFYAMLRFKQFLIQKDHD